MVPGVLKAGVAVGFAGREKTTPRVDLNVLECNFRGRLERGPSTDT
jgi:hypothetical protein